MAVRDKPQEHPFRETQLEIVERHQELLAEEQAIVVNDSTSLRAVALLEQEASLQQVQECLLGAEGEGCSDALVLASAVTTPCWAQIQASDSVTNTEADIEVEEETKEEPEKQEAANIRRTFQLKEEANFTTSNRPQANADRQESELLERIEWDEQAEEWKLAAHLEVDLMTAEEQEALDLSPGDDRADVTHRLDSPDEEVNSNFTHFG